MSVSHSKFSFPKTDRFKDKYIDVFYEIPDTKSKRKTNLGYGQKSQLVNKYIVSPGPAQYQNHTISRNKSENNIGISIGYGRQQVKANSYIPIKDSPLGPNQYQIPNTLNKISYSLSGRHKELSKMNTPGPGQYSIQSTLQANGKYSLSNLSNSRCLVFNPPQSVQKIPGPGEYSIQDQKERGQYIKSTMKNQNPFTFQKKQRIIFEINNKNPGPGAYKINSIFI